MRTLNLRAPRAEGHALYARLGSRPSAQGRSRLAVCATETEQPIRRSDQDAEAGIEVTAHADEDKVASWRVLVGLSTLVALVCSIDRAAMSVALLPMSTEYLWDDSTKGLISSAFFLGYTVTNLVGGYVATRYPPKTVLALGVAIWSLFTILTPFAAETGQVQNLVLCRFVMGLGEGVTFPCIQNLVAGNVPDASKPRSLALVYSGVQSGTIVALLTAPLIISYFEWPAIFYIFGSVGFVWLAGWLPLAKDRMHAPLPRLTAAAEGSRPTPDGGDRALSGAQASTSAGTVLQEQRAKFDFRSVPWRDVMRNKAFLAVLVAHAGWGFGHTICFAWLPNYYYTEYGLQVRDSAILSALPWICTVIVTNAGGSLADWLVNNGTMTRGQSRKAFQLAGSFGPAACLLYLAAAASHHVPALSLTGAVGLMSATLALGGLTCTGFASNHQDLTARYTGILFGLTNAASSLTGTGSTYATGAVLDATGSWSIVFEMVAIVYIASAALYAAWASADNQFDSAAARERAAQL